MDPIFAQYEERLIRRRRSHYTLRAYRYAIAKFEGAIAGANPATLEPWRVEDVFDGLELSWNTRRNVLVHVRAAYRYAHRRGVLAVDPTYDVDLGPPPDREPVIIPNQELRAIQAGLRTANEVLLFRLFAYTGMRRHEVVNLRWEDVNLVSQRMRVVGKGSKLRHVPVHPALGELLAGRRYHMGQPVVRWVHWDHLKEMAPGRTFHDFRRTTATSLRRNGVQPQVIDRIMGWAPRGMMGRYYDHVAEEEMKAGILRLYVDDPIG